MADYLVQGSFAYVPLASGYRDGGGVIVPQAYLLGISDGTKVVPVGPGVPVPVTVVSNAGGTQTVVVANGPLTYAAPATGSVGTSSAPLITAGTYNNLIIITTAPTSAGNVFLGLGSAAVVGSGFCVPAGGGSITFSKTGPVPLPASGQAINAISDSGTVAVSIQGA